LGKKGGKIGAPTRVKTRNQTRGKLDWRALMLKPGKNLGGGKAGKRGVFGNRRWFKPTRESFF